MEQKQQSGRITFLKQNRAAFALLAISLCCPFLLFGLGGYLGYPDWQRSWFSPFELPIMIVGVLCCGVAPFVAAGSFSRRVLYLFLAFGALAIATLVASFLGIFAFGLPMD